MLAVRRYRHHKDQDDDDEERNDDIDASLQSIVALPYSGAHQPIVPVVVSKTAAASSSTPPSSRQHEMFNNPLYVPNAFFVTNELAEHVSQVPTSNHFPFTV
jgi:hypothetical protein